MTTATVASVERHTLNECTPTYAALFNSPPKGRIDRAFYSFSVPP